MGKLCLWLCLMLIALPCPGLAAEGAPLKVARMPIVLGSYQEPDREAMDSLEI